MKTPKICESCGTEFVPKNHTVGRFCSTECFKKTTFNVERNTPKTCRICGKSFVDKKHPDRIYCSPACQTEGRKRIEQRECLHCGKIFIANPSDKKRFCSISCAGLHNPKPRAKKTCVCEWCGKTFNTWNSRPGRFCSRLCAGRYGARQPKLNARKPEIHVIKPCVICGKPYHTTTHQIKYRGSSCCSRECANIHTSQVVRGEHHPNWRGGSVHGRGTNWSMQRNKVLRRDGYRCQICHKKVSRFKHDYGIHHIIPYRTFNGDYLKANELTNLITLCRSCHAKVEWGKIPCPQPLF